MRAAMASFDDGGGGGLRRRGGADPPTTTTTTMTPADDAEAEAEVDAPEKPKLQPRLNSLMRKLAREPSTAGGAAFGGRAAAADEPSDDDEGGNGASGATIAEVLRGRARWGSPQDWTTLPFNHDDVTVIARIAADLTEVSKTLSEAVEGSYYCRTQLELLYVAEVTFGRMSRRAPRLGSFVQTHKPRCTETEERPRAPRRRGVTVARVGLLRFSSVSTAEKKA